MFSHRSTLEVQRQHLDWFWTSVSALQKHQETWLQDWLDSSSADEKAKAHAERWLEIFRKGCNQAQDNGNALLNFLESKLP